MKRALWTQRLTKHSAPPWPCPACGKGILSLIPKSLIFKETASSRESHSDDSWEPEFTTYAFCAWLKCGHASCPQEVVVSGWGGLTAEFDSEEGMGWAEVFQPLFCWPMPEIFELPANWPDKVTAELRAAFSLFWSDQAAAAGRVRAALERLLDKLGVQKRRKVKNGKFSDLTLHQRIELFHKGEPAIGTQLMALKWLGNTGSHEGAISRDDLLDAFEILEHALGELIEQRTRKVAALAKRLTEKHGPRRRR